MNVFQFKKVIENKYSHLLVALVVFLIFSPFFETIDQGFSFTHFLFFIMIVAMLRILKVSKKHMMWIVFLGVSALILELLSRKIYFMVILISLAYVLFLGSTTILLIKNVFKEKRVTRDTIKGGISVYLLLGFWWVAVYSLLLMLDTNAIYSADSSSIDISSLYQFSFSTLTTVGYGNIVPKSELAITFSNLEAIIGQVYLTVFIARLVGISVIDKTEKKSLSD